MRDPRHNWIDAVVFLAIGVLYCAWSWNDQLGGFGGDNAVYLLSAQYLSPFTSHTEIAAHFFRSSPYPPLFPIVLGLVDASHHLLIAHALTTAFLAVAFFFMYRWQITLGLPKTVALAATLVFAALPGTYIQTLDILSENLYLLLTLISLYAVARYERDGGKGLLLIGATAAGLAALDRTAGAALIIAFTLFLLWHRKRIPWKAPLSIVWAPIVMWYAIHGVHAGYLSTVDVTYAHHSVATLRLLIPTQLSAIATGWLRNFLTVGSWPLVAAIYGIGLIGLVSTVTRLREGRLDSLYILLYLSVILLWPFPGESKRFVFVLVPILLTQAMLLLSQLRVVLPAGTRPLPGLMLAIIAIIALPQLVLNLHRMFEPLPPSVSAFRKTARWLVPNLDDATVGLYATAGITNALLSARHIVPRGECIVGVKPALIALLARRDAVPPPEPLLQRRTPIQCHYMLMLASASSTFSDAFDVLQLIHDRGHILRITRLSDSPSAPAVAILARARKEYWQTTSPP